MTSRFRQFLLWAGAALISGSTGASLSAGGVTDPDNSPAASPAAAHDAPVGADVVAEHKSATTSPVCNAPLAAFRNTLLDLAFQSATAIPVEPHIKDRSRAQEAVVTTCLDLDQPQRALGYVEQIDDWRRGTGYADFAFYCARHGITNDVQHYLTLADKIAEDAEDWRKDRIKVKIARTHAWLGQTQQAAHFEAGVVDSESGKVAGVKAMLADENSFDEQLSAMDAAVATGNFDLAKNALEACTQLFNRFYGDEHRRLLVEEKLRVSWNIMPVMVRIDLMTELTEFALEHKDQGKALELVNETQRLLESSKCTAEYRIPAMARLAGQRGRAGDTAKAQADADAALAMFHAERSKIMTIDRAGVLRSLAEAYHLMGNTITALDVYNAAVEEAAENPNSRPRALDLSAICRSMALHAVEPDAALWTRIRQIREGLGQPW
jgi:tetratricopeptide (TPR) repeat protein